MKTPNKDDHPYQQIVDVLDIAVNKFEKNIGVPKPTIGAALLRFKAGKVSNVTAEVANKIVTRYPNISLTWLISQGKEGEMLNHPGMQLDYAPEGNINESTTPYNTAPRGYTSIGMSQPLNLSDADKLAIYKDRLRLNDATPKDVNSVLLILISKIEVIEQKLNFNL